VVCIFNGDDIRHWSSADQFLKQFDINIPSYYQESSLPSHSSLQAYLSDNYCANRLSHKLHHLRMAEKYADVVLSCPDQSALAVRPYNQVKIPINCSLYSSSIPNNDVPIVIHAPSFRSVKGTEEILRTLATLRSEGVQFELRLLEGMDNTQVIQNLIEADVLIDQLYLPGGGMLAREGMLTGCAVASPFLSELFPASPDAPLLSINQQNLYQKLKKLLTDRNLRLSLAFTGRAFVEKHNDHTQVAQQILLALGMHQPQVSDEYDYYPTFFLEKYVLPDGEKIPEYLKVMTSQIIKKWGVPPNVNFENLVKKGLVAKEYLPPACLLHRWNSEKLVPGI
jgi:hypothetical protein